MRNPCLTFPLPHCDDCHSQTSAFVALTYWSSSFDMASKRGQPAGIKKKMIAGKQSQYERPGRVLAPVFKTAAGDAVVVDAAERCDGKTKWRLRSVVI